MEEACREKKERDRKRGILNRPVRAMVAGIPNVGKSTFINSFAGKACAKTGNKPGVTKGKQWIKINKNVELLDTPGILWPKFEDQQVGLRLAWIGSIKEEILNTTELAAELLQFLCVQYPGALKMRYGIEEEGEAVKLWKRSPVSAAVSQREARWMWRRRDFSFWMISVLCAWGRSLWSVRQISRKQSDGRNGTWKEM